MLDRSHELRILPTIVSGDAACLHEHLLRLLQILEPQVLTGVRDGLLARVGPEHGIHHQKTTRVGRAHGRDGGSGDVVPDAVELRVGLVQ